MPFDWRLGEISRAHAAIIHESRELAIGAPIGLGLALRPGAPGDYSLLGKALGGIYSASGYGSSSRGLAAQCFARISS